MRPCLDCGTPATGTRCDAHTRVRNAFENGVYNSPAYRAERAVLVGKPCEIRLPGCTGVATTADHLVPVSMGGAGGALRPACLHCNSARRDRT